MFTAPLQIALVLPWRPAASSIRYGLWRLPPLLAAPPHHRQPSSLVSQIDSLLPRRIHRTLNRLDHPCISFNAATFASLLRYHGNATTLPDAQRIHHHIIRRGVELDAALSSTLVHIYANIGALEDARALFGNKRQLNVFTWNFLLKAYARQGQYLQALHLFDQMLLEGIAPNRVTFLSILDACAGRAGLDEVDRLHALIMDHGLESDAVLGTALLNIYGQFGSVEVALTIFNKISERDVVAWTSMIAAYVQHGRGKEALDLFNQMQRDGTVPNRVTFITALSACDNHAEGKWVHACILDSGFESDVVVGTSLVKMYGNCGSLSDARRMFHKIANPNSVSWNAIIAVYSQHGQRREALQLFDHMQLAGLEPNKETYVSLLATCASYEALTEGEQLHTFILDGGFESDITVGNALVNMYGKCGSLQDAQRIFDKMPERNVVSWTVMISVYAQHGQFQALLHTFDQMILGNTLPNKVTFIGILAACTSQANLDEGKRIHVCIVNSGFESDVTICNALVNMYGKYGNIEDARRIFDEMCKKDVITWTAMIVACAQHSQGNKALQIYDQMQREGARPNKITLVSVLSACAMEAALSEGKQVHACILLSGVEPDVSIGNALVNMYGKCGNLGEACWMFDRMSEHDVVSWNALIAVYAQHGQGKEALRLLHQMQKGLNVPDKVTFRSVLAACSYEGLVEEAWQLFIFIYEGRSISVAMDHYVCMIDLLGRAGQFDEAEYFIQSMPGQPTTLSFMTFLGACHSHVEVERGVDAAKYIFELDPGNAAPYVMLSNIYVACSREK